MTAQVGKSYTEEVPERFGPAGFDCSGLVWAAANSIGDALPGGPDDDGAALVPFEMEWFAAQPGVQVITSAAGIEAGDLIAFTGGDPAPFAVSLQNHAYSAGQFGHIGMATSSTEYVSAYDTAEGVVINPIAGDVFNAALRLTPALLGED
jgi:cell wall-associated NlpC family hydrolase